MTDQFMPKIHLTTLKRQKKTKRSFQRFEFVSETYRGNSERKQAYLGFSCKY